ncbi:dTDP-4-amino-4,6-dideoxygalactose transaminase [Halanaerobium congolense]|uniref:dTDP-4-amino-4,6-dideoxygalactose transaminase n=1 Tax=Halanaerobium congolense TaxID=54121 RepID=A0A1G6SQR8_9FIRM|nr:dTDP-4-amino-4,6-dideoxygalactose transaminase [Halanaerobium congolense]SDD19189.1 dTDP-4-amino-4,6-dideoxygalactose transaminase [Halanaerobium congolense]
MINFNVPLHIDKEIEYIKEAIEENNKISGDGPFTKKCHNLIENKFNCSKVLLTTSGTHALELAALLIDIQKGDEVIMPSYTFTSTANAFVLKGAKIKFIDIEPETMNIDADLIEKAITKKTKAIVPVHYAGVSCDMNKINSIADEHDLYVIEDAAQGVMSKYNDEYLGTLGDLGCYSFHETKNYSSGEGGALVINNDKFKERAEIIREKGTNRSQFLRGQVDKYTWQDFGSSYLPSEINAAYLYAQLEKAEEINEDRLSSWNLYYKLLKPLEDKGMLNLPYIPDNREHNAHMFYVKTHNLKERTELISYLKENGIQSVFHYIPLHSTKAGEKFSEFVGEDNFTTIESEKLVRLPMYYGLKEQDIKFIVDKIVSFYDRTAYKGN